MEQQKKLVKVLLKDIDKSTLDIVLSALDLCFLDGRIYERKLSTLTPKQVEQGIEVNEATGALTVGKVWATEPQ